MRLIISNLYKEWNTRIKHTKKIIDNIKMGLLTDNTYIHIYVYILFTYKNNNAYNIYIYKHKAKMNILQKQYDLYQLASGLDKI